MKIDRKEIIIEGQGNFTDLIQPTVGIEAAQIYNAIYAYLQVAPFHVTHRFIHDVLRPEIPVLELPEMMHIDELIELKTAGVQIGNHSWNHYMLHHGVPEGILNKEIIESKSWLEEQLNIEVNCFAFPNGLFDAESLGKVEESGYSQILFTHQGAQNKVNHFNRTDFYHPIYSKNLIRMAYNR